MRSFGSERVKYLLRKTPWLNSQHACSWAIHRTLLSPPSPSIQGLVVYRADKATQRINRHPAEKVIAKRVALSTGQRFILWIALTDQPINRGQEYNEVYYQINRGSKNCFLLGRRVTYQRKFYYNCSQLFYLSKIILNRPVRQATLVLKCKLFVIVVLKYFALFFQDFGRSLRSSWRYSCFTVWRITACARVRHL